jgi:uncharacterized membrane protein YkvA (DUF1232 family)
MARKKKYEVGPHTSAEEPLSARHLDFYQRLRRRMRSWGDSRQARSSKWSEYVLIAPDIFHLVCRLALDPSVALQHRVKLAAVAAYYIAPFDLFAEVLLGPIGFLDDLAVAAFVLNGLLRDTPEETVRKHWAGDGDILDWLQRVVQSTDTMLGGRLAGRVRKQVKSL